MNAMYNLLTAFLSNKKECLVGALIVVLEITAAVATALGEDFLFLVYLGLLVLVSFFVYVLFGRSARRGLKIATATLLWSSGLLSYAVIAMTVIAPPDFLFFHKRNRTRRELHF